MRFHLGKNDYVRLASQNYIVIIRTLRFHFNNLLHIICVPNPINITGGKATRGQRR